MTAALAVHQFPATGQAVRTVTVDGEPWFVAADVARILGYRMASDMTRRLDGEDRGTRPVRTPSGEQEMTIISEPGLYAAILGSKIPGARAFKRWVTHEVLPAIRKTGQYEVAHSIPQTYAEALQLAANQAREIERQAVELSEAKPKAESWDVLASGRGDFSVADAAKILSRDPLITTGERRLFATLADLGWLYRAGDGNWRAYQRQVDAGRLSELPRTYTHPRTGESAVAAPQIRITPRGLHDLHRHLGGKQPLQLPLEITR